MKIVGKIHIRYKNTYIFKLYSMNLKWVEKCLYTGYLSFSVSGEYYLGFVDAKYNAGRPRPGEVQHRNYILNVWKTQCLYWREKENRWSPDGCWATDMSTYSKTHCRLLYFTYKCETRRRARVDVHDTS